MSEYILKVGKRGEIYTTQELRQKTGIREGGKVKATIVGGKLIIEPLITVSDVLAEPVDEITPEEAEKLSGEAQVEAGLYG